MRQVAAAVDIHLFAIVEKDIVLEAVALRVGQHLQPDFVVGKEIVAIGDSRIGLQRRCIGVDAGAIVDDTVALQQHITGFLKPDAVAAWSAIVGKQVATQLKADAVHDINADRVVAEDVLLNHVVVGLHQMQPVAAGGEIVAAHDAVGRIPEQGVARVAHHVVFDQCAWAVEDFQPIAASRDRQIHAVDRVAAHNAVRRLLQVDAKEGVLDAIVFDHGVGARGANAGVLAVERRARAAHDQPAHRHAGR